jgi:hypothetical protein
VWLRAERTSRLRSSLTIASASVRSATLWCRCTFAGTAGAGADVRGCTELGAPHSRAARMASAASSVAASASSARPSSVCTVRSARSTAAEAVAEGRTLICGAANEASSHGKRRDGAQGLGGRGCPSEMGCGARHAPPDAAAAAVRADLLEVGECELRKVLCESPSAPRHAWRAWPRAPLLVHRRDADQLDHPQRRQGAASHALGSAALGQNTTRTHTKQNRRMKQTRDPPGRCCARCACVRRGGRSTRERIVQHVQELRLHVENIRV